MTIMNAIICRELIPFIGLVFLTVFLLHNAQLENHVRKFFFVILCCEFAEMVAYECEEIAAGWSEPTFLRILCSILGYVLRPLLLYLFLLLNHRGDRSRTFATWAAVPCIVNCLLVSTALFSGIVFSFSPDNHFHRGPLGYVPFIAIGIYMLLFLGSVVWKSLGRWQSESSVLLIIFAFMLFSTCWEPRVPEGTSILRSAIVISTLAYYLYFQTHLLKKSLQEEQRLREHAEENSRIAVVMSQIQPHFLFNSLNSICYLIRKDPARAEVALVKFSGYLRQNLDSLNRRTAIPFRSELEHTEVYLVLEQLRFGEKLNVVYDIGVADFKLPPLSLQPIVENAVRHGVGRKEEGGTITIKTRQTEDAYQIIVSDDGVGFDPTAPLPEDGRSHVGIENVRARLLSITGGELKLHSRPGIGTIATIIIPKEKKHL